MAGVGRKPNASLSSGPDPENGAYAAMVARAESLIPQLSARASRTEELRRLRRCLFLAGFSSGY